MLRNSDLQGFKIEGEPEKLITTLFADDTTVYLSKEDSFENLQAILEKWCKASGAKFNVKKTEILPVGGAEYRDYVVRERRMNETQSRIPDDIHIAKDGEPVRILGAFVGNTIEQIAIWTPIVEKINANLNQWEKGHPTQEGRRLIVGMEVGGRTQYLTRVQGMPKEVEHTLTKMIQKFMWGDSAPLVGAATLTSPISDGGKKLLDIEARNQAIELMKVKGGRRGVKTKYVPPRLETNNTPREDKPT
ncbi:hypothetical protein BD410DRAFT_816480 [Rickenella mellea]|uniref:Uncharacterized protein n=1 Tax=Rickenella mellea TaxID=50990 RepID=A0A4Y7PQP6_9AGAM|nr:hypothetical protein BD410DRAFT_816480 [Rickenella mellea]